MAAQKSKPHHSCCTVKTSINNRAILVGRGAYTVVNLWVAPTTECLLSYGDRTLHRRNSLTIGYTHTLQKPQLAVEGHFNSLLVNLSVRKSYSFSKPFANTWVDLVPEVLSYQHLTIPVVHR